MSRLAKGPWKQEGKISWSGLTAMNVPGRKTMVITEIVFIAELSRLLAAAMRRESAATEMFIRLSRCAIRL